MADRLKDQMKSGIVLLGAQGDESHAPGCAVTRTWPLGTGPETVKGYRPNCGGDREERADMAQAGGPRIEKLPEALERIYDLI